MKVKCIQCGTDVLSTSKFCTTCGMQMPKQSIPATAGGRTSFCPECGTAVPDASKFCTGCGTQVPGQDGTLGSSALEPKENLSLFGYFQQCFGGNYANFKGRARRKEYWGFVLFSGLFTVVLGLFSLAILVPTIVCGLALFLPSVAVTARRLHDIGKPLAGWRALIVFGTSIMSFIPYFSLAAFLIGIPFTIIWGYADGQPGTNKYGPNPKGIQ